MFILFTEVSTHYAFHQNNNETTFFFNQKKTHYDVSNEIE